MLSKPSQAGASPRSEPGPAAFCGITLTGADESTPLDALQGLLRHSEVELAFLFTLNEAGPRFVRYAWLREVLPSLHGRLALHVCGPAARQQLEAQALAGLMPYLSRVQVNGPVSQIELARLAARVPELITQHHPGQVDWANLPLPRRSLLVDASSGQGRLPPRWERPRTGKPVGFAGGLRLPNLRVELDAIAAVAEGSWWIDLETGLRSARDRFDPELAACAVQVTQAWIQASNVNLARAAAA